MRVTTRMVMDQYLRDLNANHSRIWGYQRQVATGIKLHRPSDNPVDVARSMRFSSELTDVQRFVSNALEARDWLEATEGAINEVQQVFHRARELAVRGATGTLDDSSRQAIVDEIEVIIDHLLQIANTSYKGRYLFAGTLTTVSPFVRNEDPGDPTVVTYSYRGNSARLYRQLGPDAELEINLTGDETFFVDDPNNPGEQISAFQVLLELRDRLLSADSEAISEDSLVKIDLVADNLSALRSKIGARVNRTELAVNRLEDLALQIETMNSELLHADVAEAMVRLRSAEVTLQAALATGARLIQPTLADFLR